LVVEEEADAGLTGGLAAAGAWPAAASPVGAVPPELPLASVPPEERLARVAVGVAPALRPWMSMIKRHGFGSKKAE
jgi:hypothetical protein